MNDTSIPSKRPLHPLTEEAVQEGLIRPAILVFLDFPDDPVYAHNRLGEIVYDGNTYIGVGNMGSISKAQEGLETRPYSVNLTLNGLDPEFVTQVMNTKYQGRVAKVIVVFLDVENQVIGDPVIDTQYQIDVAEGSVTSDTATITIRLQSRLANWARATPGRYTDQHQVSRFPDDRGLEFVAEMADIEINWGVPGGGATSKGQSFIGRVFSDFRHSLFLGG